MVFLGTIIKSPTTTLITSTTWPAVSVHLPSFTNKYLIFKVEYAMEAISHAGTCLGILATDGILIAAEKKNVHKLLDDSVRLCVIWRQTWLFMWWLWCDVARTSLCIIWSFHILGSAREDLPSERQYCLHGGWNHCRRQHSHQPSEILGCRIQGKGCHVMVNL